MIGLVFFKVMPRLEELKLFTSQQESRTADPKDNNIRKNDREKRKSGADINDEESPVKRQKDASQITKKSYLKDKGQAQDAFESRKIGDEKTKNGDGMDQQEMKGSAPDTKSKAYTDLCTAFISNLDLKASICHVYSFPRDLV